MPLFSIIVPVYNAEKTIQKCLESIRSQTETNYEVLMIENGSRDRSRMLCTEYAEKDPRFRLFVSAENKGPSGARNIGLENAAGEWIAFVDSDDFVDPDYLDVLHSGFQAADVVFFGYRQLSAGGDVRGEHLPQVVENMDYHEKLLQLHRQDLFGYTWIKAFRADVIGAHRFSEKLNLMEDEVFACEVLTERRRIAVVPQAIYNYISGNPGSLIGRTYTDYCSKADCAYKAWKHLLNSYENGTAALEDMANIQVDRCMYYFFERKVNGSEFCRSLSECEFYMDATKESIFYDNIKNRRYAALAVMRYAYHIKVRMARLLKGRIHEL